MLVIFASKMLFKNARVAADWNAVSSSQEAAPHGVFCTRMRGMGGCARGFTVQLLPIAGAEHGADGPFPSCIPGVGAAVRFCAGGRACSWVTGTSV